MKYINQPRPKEFEQFWPKEHAWPYGVAVAVDHGGSYYAVWNELHQSNIRIEEGDWVCVDDPGDVYPVKRVIFEATYTSVE